MDERIPLEYGEAQEWSRRLASRWISAAKSRCRQNAHRGIQWTLSFEKVYELMFSSPCTYCARPNEAPFRMNGRVYSGAMSIDRIDSDKSYTPLNCVSACKICQKAKNDLGLIEYIRWVETIRANPDQSNYQHKYDPSELDHPGAKAKYRAYEYNAKYRGIEWNLSKERALLCFQSPCYYCLCPPSNCYRSGKIEYYYTGIDRRNNDIGYIDENCFPACFWCNRAKNDMPEGWFGIWTLTAQQNLPYVKQLFRQKKLLK